jgi:hypothetical protein
MSHHSRQSKARGRSDGSSKYKVPISINPRTNGGLKYQLAERITALASKYDNEEEAAIDQLCGIQVQCRKNNSERDTISKAQGGAGELCSNVGCAERTQIGGLCRHRTKPKEGRLYNIGVNPSFHVHGRQ